MLVINDAELNLLFKHALRLMSHMSWSRDKQKTHYFICGVDLINIIECYAVNVPHIGFIYWVSYKRDLSKFPEYMLVNNSRVSRRLLKIKTSYVLGIVLGVPPKEWRPFMDSCSFAFGFI